MTNTGDMLVISSISGKEKLKTVNKASAFKFQYSMGKKNVLLKEMFQKNRRGVKSLSTFLLSNTEDQ